MRTEPKSAAVMGQCLAQTAAYAGETVAYRYLADGEGESESITFAELYSCARRLAVSALSVARPGDRCILLCEAGIDFAIGLHACFLAGIVAVPVPTPHINRIAAKGGQLLEVVRDCRPQLVMIGSYYWSKRREFQGLGWEIAALDFLAIGRDSAPTQAALPVVESHDLALLQYTSGSTSLPKGVMLTHGNLMANQLAIAGITDPEARQTYCTWLPAYHDMGLAFYLQPVMQMGTTIILPTGHFLQRPVRWLNAMSKYRCTFSACPNFALERLADSIESVGAEQVNLAALEVIVVGAEPISAQSVRRILPLLISLGMREEALCPCYGLAETVTLATLTPSAKKVTIALMPLGPESIEAGTGIQSGAAESARVGNGNSAPLHGLRVVDPVNRKPVADATIGEIWFKGPSVGAGYWDKPAETDTAFGGRLAGDPDPWLRTGDLGLIQGGELFILGRSKDLVIVRGRNLYPADIERTAQSVHSSIFAVAAFPVRGADQSEGLGVAVELRRGHAGEGPAVESAVRAALAQQHDVEVQWLGMFLQSALPRTTSGKMKRAAIALLAAEGQGQEEVATTPHPPTGEQV